MVIKSDIVSCQTVRCERQKVASRIKRPGANMNGVRRKNRREWSGNKRWKAWRYYDTVCPLLHASIAFIEYILCMHSLNISLGPHIIKQITQKHHITATSNTIQDCVVFLNCGLSILSIERNKKKNQKPTYQT